jgi:hypothetical protein
MSGKNLIQIDSKQTPYECRLENGFLIVPVVMMTEGVRNGSGGPVLHLSDNYSQEPEAWDGVPVTVNHPSNSDDQFVSVNSVEEDQWVVGELKDARVEKNKLKANAYISEQRAIAINPQLINYLSEARPLDVSIGALTKDQPDPGTYDGDEYDTVTMAYWPDHLALLPGGQGACSWDDGCGVRVNKSESEESDMKPFLKVLKSQIKKNGGNVIDGLQNNEIGFVELSKKVQSELDGMDSQIRTHYLTEVYNDYFIYQVRNSSSGKSSFYKQPYALDDDGIEFEQGLQEVKKEVQFTPMQALSECNCNDEENSNFNNSPNTMKRNKNSDGNELSGDVMEKVVGLIDSEQTRFGKSDRTWLLELNSDQLNVLEPMEPVKTQVNKDEAVKALSEELSDIEKLTGIISNDVKSKVKLGLKSYKDARQQLIKSIQDNTSNEDWPTDTLEDMKTDNLKRLSKSVRPVDYSGQGPVTTNEASDDDIEMLLPAGVELESKTN